MKMLIGEEDRRKASCVLSVMADAPQSVLGA